MLRDASSPFVYFRFGLYNCSVVVKIRRGTLPYVDS